LAVDIPAIQADSTMAKNTKTFLNALKKDTWVHEAMDIIVELKEE